ncbi:hypothetical protein GCM10007940_43440 [Portibacter lacus]|uniref:Uncharacterized protein n=2 Tax=Portibacter lacus TaxID=1099794 RepID=A0AA37SY35_9BACT|nr:hypothetical protein GCM10007940_43440 [Portibacter lacus]
MLSLGRISAQDEISIYSNDDQIKLSAVAEIGFLGVLDHKIQFGQNGTYLNYVKEGGQNTLFPVTRLSLELEFKKKNTFVFLYQPLTIKTTALLSEDLIVDNLTYPAGSGVDFLYNFPFYRLSYMRELLSDNEKYSFGIGGTIQIRNATISFESTDGERFRTNTDIGIVPALKIRGRSNFTDRFYGEIEADGIYAPVSYLNGSTNEIVGAILDASVRAGYKIENHVNTFLNVRYLGGGAVGTSSDDSGPGDGYTRNWLHFITVSTGFVYEF